MTLALAQWAVVAAVLGALALGLGLLVERTAGRRLPNGLLVPAGLAALLVVGELASWLGLPRAVPIVFLAVATVAGLTTRRRNPLAGVAWQGVAAAAVVAGFYLVVVAATGQATFGGYTVLGDTAIHLVGADALPGSLSSIRLADGSFGAMIDVYYRQSGYPRGGAALLGTLSAVTGVDPVRALQPLLAIAMAALSSAAWVLLTPIVPARSARALGSTAAGLSALTAGFLLQGSLKEVLAATMLATCAAGLGWAAAQAERAADGNADAAQGGGEESEHVARAPGARLSIRTAVPGAVAAAALLASIGLAGGVYLVPLGGVVLVAWWRAAGPQQTLRVAAGALAVAVVLCLPSLLRLVQQAGIAGNVLTAQEEIGNLARGGLPRITLFGIWLGGDVRLRDDHHGLTQLLALLMALAATAGAVAAARAKATGLLGWAVAAVLATILVVRAGSPWADAKALVIASPLVLTLAAAGLGATWGASVAWRRRAAFAAAAVLGLGLCASLLYTARDVAPAPGERFAELQRIDDRFAGQGPMLTGEFEEFDRHLLRRTRGEFAGDLFAVPPDRHGQAVFGRSADQDQLDPVLVQQARLLLVRPGPYASRPPSNFSRVWRGRWYEVWRRDGRVPAPRARLGLGDAASGGYAAPACADLKAFAATAQPGEQVVTAFRTPAAVVGAPAYATAPGWAADGVHPDVVRVKGPARLQVKLSGLTPSAPVDLWFEGSAARAVRVTAGGVRGQVGPLALNPIGSSTRVLTANAAADGSLTVTLERGGQALRAGTGDRRDGWGAVGATERDALGRAEVARIEPADVSQWCGRAIDWLELAPRGVAQAK